MANPLLDVSDAILDPMFANTGLTYTRNSQTVGTNGLAADTGSPVNFSGVVTNDRGDILDRTADASRVQGNIVIHTLVRLVEGAPGIDADTVTYNGNSYRVKKVNDYSPYGAGFTAASCELLPLSG